ncbi:hypothetical protein NPX13_g11257 [Xylaria arbuscula]|uniref:Uncharacterized protein n=1 Tax=Xylaria arbuscula TaxID=114810 RepID=A0A9W8TFT2_9PEZI|nr:hypothetical protein NPX13_g11257 [Xylaria arbuscula]
MDTSLSSSPITGMSTPTSPISSSGGNSGSRSSKSSLSSSPFSWFRSSPHRSNKKRKSTISKDDPAFARLHKPFTPQNLEHQRMFESFEWNFGGSSSSGSSNDDDDSYRRRRSSSISPRETRDMTIDDYALQNQSLQGSLSSAFSCLSTRDAGRQGYDQTTAAHY